MNVALRALGLGGWTQAWLGDPKTALPSLIFVTTLDVDRLQHGGAAGGAAFAADGGDRGGRARQLRLGRASSCSSSCRWSAPTLLNLIVLSFIGKMKIFDLVWITTKGGPLWATETVSTYVYKRAFEWTTFDLGYPSTIAAVWFVIVLARCSRSPGRSASASKLEY